MSSDDVRYRKLSPIYNALDAANYKGAIKLCQRKEIEKWDICQAIVAYSLVMQGRKVEGLNLAREIKDKKPVDEDVLNMLNSTFKITKSDEDAVECYENAVKLHPESEKYPHELFSCYLRLANFKKAQQLSQKLFKATGKSKYVFWTVCCMLHQTDLPLNLLDLGDKMIQKAFDDSNEMVEMGNEELQLLIEIKILKSRKMMSDEVKFSILIESLTRLQSLCGNLPNSCRKKALPIDDSSHFLADTASVKPFSLHLRFMKLRLLDELVKSGWRDVNLSYRNTLLEIITELPDQWDVLKRLVDSEFERCSDTPIEIGYVACIIRDLQRKSPFLRGPFLAELYLYSRISLFAIGDDTNVNVQINNMMKCLSVSTISGTEIAESESCQSISVQYRIIQLLIQYIEKFDTKQCCFTDIKPYLLLVEIWPGNLGSWLLSRLELLKNDEKLVEDSKLWCKLVKTLQIITYLKPSLLVDTSFQEFTVMYSSYAKIFASRCVGGLREVQPPDELLLYLVYNLKRQNAFSDVECLGLLFLGKISSPFNYVFNVELLDCLRRFSLGLSAYEVFSALEVKFIQYDTLSYLVMPTLLESAQYNECLQLNRSIISFHENARRESNEMMSRCFVYSNYAKSLEINNFQKRCQKSLQLSWSKAEFPLINILENLHTVGDITKYLQEYIGGFTLESQLELTNEDLLQLSNNCDFDLIAPYDLHLSESSATEKKAIIRSQMIRRIVHNQKLVNLLLSYFQGDCITASLTLTSLWNYLFDGDLSFDCEHISFTNKQSNHLKWSQSVDCGSDFFELQCSKLCLSSIDFCIKVVGAFKSSSKYEQSVDHLQQLKIIVDIIISDLQSSTHECITLQARTIVMRKLSAFIYLVANSVSPCLNYCATTIGALTDTKKKSKKPSKLVTNSLNQAEVLEFGLIIRNLFDTIASIANNDMIQSFIDRDKTKERLCRKDLFSLEGQEATVEAVVISTKSSLTNILKRLQHKNEMLALF